MLGRIVVTASSLMLLSKDIDAAIGSHRLVDQILDLVFPGRRRPAQ
jgi:hypothetical protein